MVAAANSDHGSAVSHQTHSVESPNSQGAKQTKGAKKSALGVFAKLLAGLTRTAKAGGEDAGGPGAEGSIETGKTARGGKTGSAKKADAPAAQIPAQGKGKIQNRDRRFLASLQGEGEGLASEASAQDRPAKKAKQAQKDSQGEEAALLAVAAGEDPLRGAPHNDGLPGQADQDGLNRLAGKPVPDAPDQERVLRGKRGEGADPGEDATASAKAGALAASPRQARGTEREEPGPAKKAAPGEAKNSRKNRERVVLEVQDLRTEGNGAALSPGQEPNPGVEAGAERVADIRVDLGSNGKNQEPAQTGRTKTAGEAFGDILARELHQNLNGDIVRQASILVKDGGEGTIRLSLKPESLGMVKVRLEMAENKITGRIIVESNEALRAFEKEIHSLEQAFRDSGFAGASLEMALSGDGGQGGQGQRDGAQALFSSRAVSSSYDAMAETMDVFAAEAGFDGFAGPGVSRVNVLV